MKVIRNSEHGYSLITTTAMLVVLGMATVVGLSMHSVHKQNKNIQSDAERQLSLKVALDNFKAKNNRMPCPAPMTAAPDSAEFGKEISSNCASATPITDATWRVTGRDSRAVHIGALPVRTLNLDDSYAFDSARHRIMYAVTEEYASPGAAFNQNHGAITILDGSGNTVTEAGIYLFVMPGRDTRGAYSVSGVLQDPCASGTIAGENCDNANANFISAPFNISTANGAERYTASFMHESSLSHYYWDIGAWAPACPTACGSPATAQTRTVECRERGASTTPVDATLCPQQVAYANTNTCPPTQICGVINVLGGGEGGGSQGSFDSDGDGVADNVDGIGTYSGQVSDALSTADLSGGGSGGGGGKILCGHYFARGILPQQIYAGDIAYSRNVPIEVKRAYWAFATPVTHYLNDHPGGIVEKLLQPFVIGWAKEMAFRTGYHNEGSLIGKALLHTLVPLAQRVGKNTVEADISTLSSEQYVRGGVL